VWVIGYDAFAGRGREDVERVIACWRLLAGRSSRAVGFGHTWERERRERNKD